MGERRLIHDHGSQFVSREWRACVAAIGLTDIRTRVKYLEFNGVLERLHCTYREEGLVREALIDCYSALDAMVAWGHYRNNERPHSALDYLRPADYYRGDPAARLAEREQKLH